MNDKIVVPKLEKGRLMEYFWAVRKIPLFQRLVLQADDEKFLLSKEGFLMPEGMRTWKNKRLLVRKDYATIVSETSIYFAFSVRDMPDEQLQQLIQWVSEGK